MAVAAEDKDLAERLLDCSVEGKKKKKPRHKEGRHKLKKDRIEVREKWLAEKKKNGPFAKSHFFGAYQHLLANFSCKVALPNAKVPQEADMTSLNRLSKKVVQLLRWDLPSSGLPYLPLDGSAHLTDVAKYFGIQEDAILFALSPEVGGKPRVMAYEVGLGDQQKKRICTLGGHGFPVHSPLGHCLISKQSASCYPDLIHETDKSEQIQNSGFVSAMSRFGGVNFSVGVHGGYRSHANCLVTIQARELAHAIAGGWEFYENRFTGIVFGTGKWDRDGWDGRIPSCFLHFKSV